MKALKVFAVLNAVFITTPIFFFVYQFLFPALYFLGLCFLPGKDDAAFFWGFWILELVLIIALAKFLFKFFSERRIIYVKIFTQIAFALFTIFCFTIVPRYSDFPSESTSDIEKRDSLYVVKEISKSTNKYSIPSFYYSDKLRIDATFSKYYDSISKYINDTDLNKIRNAFFNYSAIKKISVDTILYGSNYNELFVTLLYESPIQNEFAGIGLIGYRTASDSIIKLYNIGTTLYPYLEESRSAFITNMRKIYFIENRSPSYNLLKYSPLDSQYWTGPLFKRDLRTSLYPFEIKRDSEDSAKINVLPYILVPPAR